MNEEDLSDDEETQLAVIESGDRYEDESDEDIEDVPEQGKKAYDRKAGDSKY
jgi:hypothetical protein